MEVTKTNLKSLLPEIKSAIDNCTFLAIDCELTGLNTGNDINGYDIQKTYYEKVSRNMRNFLVIQYGICAFKYDKEADIFKQSAYNFYVFRRPINKNIPDMRFLCQSSSIDFLSNQGFDFNKLFKEGISYLNINEEERYRDNLQELEKTKVTNLNTPQEKNNIINISKDDRPFIDDIIQKIQSFIESDDKEIALPRCNAFLRRLIYQTAQEKFNDKVSLQTKQLENKDRVIFVTKFKSKEELEKEIVQKMELERELLEEAIGFSKVIKLIVDSGKLVIGHNMCLDLLHTVDKFLTPLPREYKEFKECISCLFTRILDTKYMSSVSPLKELIASNVLSHLLETILKEPFTLPTVEIEENREGYNLTDVKEHEAGYDAYITGMVFLAMWKYLGNQSEDKNKSLFNFSELKPYINKLYIMKVFDGSYINLGGADLQPKRDHVLHITFPKEWKTNNIIQLFSPFGSVNVAWIDDQSAYVGLQKPEQLKVALKTLSQSDTYKIMTYSKREAMLNNNVTTEKRTTPMKVYSNNNKINKFKRPLRESDDAILKRRIVSITASSVVPTTDDVSNKTIVTADVDLLKNEEIDYGVPVKRTNKRKRTISKTFEEASSWD